MWSNNDGMDPNYKSKESSLETGLGSHSYQSILEQFILLRAAVVYARQAIGVPRSPSESEAALILEKARKEADEIMKRYSQPFGKVDE
jgi:hypothetical protein